MNKSELIATLATKGNFPEAITKHGVELFFASIKKALDAGDRVEIRDFGVFCLKAYKGYQGRNPKTGEPVAVPQKRLPVFRPGKDLKKRVDQLEA